MVFRVSYAIDNRRQYFLFDTKDYPTLVNHGQNIDDVVDEIKTIMNQLIDPLIEYLEPKPCTLDAMVESLKKHYEEI